MPGRELLRLRTLGGRELACLLGLLLWKSVTQGRRAHAPGDAHLTGAASSGACVVQRGQLLLAGARSFFRSLDAAIFLFSRVSHIPAQSLVLPCVCTNDRLTLGAELQVRLLPLGLPLHPSLTAPAVAGCLRTQCPSAPVRRVHLGGCIL